ncbi:Retrovirus-related Pol poly from transposon, partial [Brachionus plicatilis]
MDIAGPFTKSDSGFEYILVMVCAFTKFALAFALKSTTAEVVAEIVIKRWISLFGVMEFILSDRGK